MEPILISNKILTEYKDGVRTIKLNRARSKNAIDPEMYITLTNILNKDATDDKIVLTLITGNGQYFSSGNDINSIFENKVEDSIQQRINIVQEMVKAFINYPKLLVAIVNGPAIGIAATMSVLCDIVYASDKAVFDTPFVKLGLCMEGASSFTFPAILGKSKASEVLILNHKLSAQEAYQFGFISKVIPHDKIDEFVQSLFKYGKLSVQSVKVNKKLLMTNHKKVLNECNEREMKQLVKCLESDEFLKAITDFINRKSKL